MKQLSFLAIIFYSLSSFTQNETASNPLQVSGYLETYFAYDFANPENHTRPSFLYSYNRHNEVALNLGLIKLSYQKQNLRSNIALMAGSYPNSNLAAEPGVLKNIYEANIGFKLSESKNVWIDAGVFSSHIGFESAIGKDCWNLTRSILAENSPYYESGVKVSYTTKNEKLLVSGLILNGWQRMQRVNGNNTPAVGHQITFKPTDKITLNSSSFVGNDAPDSIRVMRYFHNFYGIFQLNEKVGFTIGFDCGAQQVAKNDNNFNTWYSPVIILKVAPTKKISLAARGELYQDKNGVIISTGTPNGFQTVGYSLNVDYNIQNNLVLRIEGRGFSSEDAIFINEESPVNDNFFVISSLAFSF
ncbi:MAG: porin [Chitinophagales bacterium]|nr:porin [Chitinophagales bacterium]